MTDREVMKQVLEAWDNPMGMKDLCVAMYALRTALEQPEQEPTQWRDMVVVSLVREGINKHKARDLADHFATPPPAAQPEQEPVAWQYKTVEANIFVSEHRPVDVSVWNDIEWSKPLYTTPPGAQWDKPSASFNEWWDSDSDSKADSANPFRNGSAAYWAWAGWQAAQRPWVGLTDEEFLEACELAERGNYLLAFQRIQAKLKERNNG